MPKKSTFKGITSVPNSYFFDVFGNGFNSRISKPNLFKQITDELGTPGVQSINDLSGALQLISGTNMSISISEVDGSFTFNSSLTPENLQSITFDTDAGVSVVEGQMAWNDIAKTLDLGVGGGSVVQVGQEVLIRVLNNTGSAFVDGNVVYITGAQGNRVTAALAQANTVSGNSTIGVVTQPIPNNQEGFITVVGLVRDFNTSAWSEGDELWLSATTPGAITNVMPGLPNSAISIGFVSRDSATVGSIFVRIIRGVASVTGDSNITISGTPNNPQVNLDPVQNFTTFNLNTSNANGVENGIYAFGNSVFTWSWDGVNTSASINQNGTPYVTVTTNGIQLADVNFGAFGGVRRPQPALDAGNLQELITALGSNSGIGWVDDSAVVYEIVIDPLPGADDDNKDVFPPVNPQRHYTIKIDTTDAPKTAHMVASASWFPGDTIRFIDYAGTFTTNNFTIDFEAHNFEGLAGQTLVMNVDHGAITLEYIDPTLGFQRISVV